MNKIKNKFLSFLLNYPKLCICISLIICLSSLTGLIKITSDFTARVWFDTESQVLKDLDAFEKRFGTDQIVSIGLYNKSGKLSLDFLDKVSEITQRAWKVNSVMRVDSLTNFYHIESFDDEINIDKIIKPRDLELIKNKITKNPELFDQVVSKDFKLFFIHAQLKPLFGKIPDYEKIMDDIEEITKDYKEISFIKTGSIPITYAFKKISFSDNLKVLPVMFAFITLLLIYFYRSFAGLIIPLTVSFITIVAAIGLLGHFNIVFNSILAAIPGVLLAICLADTIHIQTTFRRKINEGLNLHDALKSALDKNLLATILTTLTTSLSFITISYTDIIPIRDLGHICAIGSFLAWLNTYLLYPSLIILLPNSWVISKRKIKEIPFHLLTQFIFKFKFFIISFFSILSIIAVYFSLKNTVNSDPIEYFKSTTEIKKDYHKAKKHFQGVRSINIDIDSLEIDGVKNPNFLNKVDQFFNALLEREDIISIHSVINIIKKVNKELNANLDSYYKIPKSSDLIAESLFLYSLSLEQGLGLDNLISQDYRYMNFRLSWTHETTNEALIAHEEVYELAEKYGLKISTGGYFPIYAKVNESVVKSFLSSMAMAIIMVSIIIFLTFKSLKLSLIALLPNTIPLFFGGLFMYLSNIYLDIGTSIVAAICLGIAVDDTIHFITHYKQNLSLSNNNIASALNETYKSTGVALILTTILLVSGFGSFVLADFLPNRYFGILCAIVLSIALIVDLLFLPAILALKKKS